ncbi:NUDIX hydrolase [Corynebacterium sp. ES2794-CONJ1]|uniref:NUDIX hydrolase n=1 Tax=unclassified Corynebacterium TaxID=2624378 RepID=UPI002167F6E8|nr:MULTISPECIES: NUDIX hydrolase [unclassified Corynebacterium]MCS4490468.1 NUDIX hydrolase [Corynebacterium sp. ES2775-CONJ]MCS4492248.1 NUDIX hydrolase [Corynebacterium sp. ES2715-CONJ3]MCS4532268.1 NUDIX hydrolase [Corynebacterium sp. ES2730-CONJ]MCU9519767.1 NUDIX hydrolase [Corynebacterium sp. ES2794-CONJ1]
MSSLSSPQGSPSQSGQSQIHARTADTILPRLSSEEILTPNSLAHRARLTKKDKPKEKPKPKRTQKATIRKRGEGRRRQGGRSTNRRGPKRPPEAHRMMKRMETSAGGLVISGLAEAVDHRGRVDLSKIYVALIGRKDRRGRLLWSMPKGHVEEHEDIEATAAREVWEETGILGEVFATLGQISYWFVSDNTRIHKTVYHYLLRYQDGVLNDEDPEVTEVAWIPASALLEYFAYADERKLAKIALRMLPDLARTEAQEGRMTPR